MEYFTFTLHSQPHTFSKIWLTYTAQKMKFSIKDFFSKYVNKSAVSCGFGHIYWRNS